MKRKLVIPSPSSKKKPDWNKLWLAMKAMYETSGMDRQRAVLENFRDQKEEICRSMNIVSEADLARLQRQIAKQQVRKGTK